ncbi:MAG: hypothetical protein PHQ72_09235 [Hespellia sp.]|nr:hypothetical protein [Hespellia sp.]
MEQLKTNCTEKNLWECIIAFQEYPFYTISGLPFSYQLKIGKNGMYTKELFISRTEHSKSLAWSSVLYAFRAAQERQEMVFSKPKQIADVRGISYTYSILWQFGIIQVPEDVVAKLQSGRKL